ncbi:formyltetrahydrofolate deformylase [Saccharopolyspora sp. K220]|uniref:formyltetrahydrofolate deformylase n=1 Tax=Saccharopolyspora soli TaxID=2926618 RepID=UPI001F5A27AF|nr:formyltetrahydrofolate deformylase [Saccharopolyspora soli]MCI2422133.1 formyltetrahydrofolate deformylase [Saccharopolyspora soli]
MNAPTATAPERPDHFALTLSCPDRAGIVYAVSRFLVEHDCSIAESQQFTDRDVNRFFMRVEFAPVGGGELDLQAMRTAFAETAADLSLTWRMHATSERPRVLIMVSKYGHCLNDLLFRANSGALDIDIPAIVSNHPDLAVMADHYRIPFHHVPVTKDTKPEAEQKLLQLVDELDIDLVVLARYMQILSPELCKALEGRAINIHHSMLPSFKGARPYIQAYERGVKFIGATAHYVTSDLDEGPIIEQAVARVDHTMDATAVTKLGRDTECLALSRAVLWHTQNRVLLDGHKTVVFS